MGASDEALLLISGLLVIVMIVLASRVTALYRALRGRQGEALTQILAVIVWVALLAQVLSFANALLIYIDRQATIDARIILFLINQFFTVAVLIWAFLKVKRMKGYD